MHELHPELVPCIQSYIQQNSAAAHLRRRDDVMYTNGVSLKDMASHVKRTLGIDVSVDTIHRLLKPVRNGTTSSKRFKSLINARVPPKKNSGEKKIHPYFHYTNSQVNLVNEMATLCSDGTLCLSVDNKNKVEVGNPAANRRTQIRSFYLENDAPNYNDHDFPYRNSKLTPAGYQILKPRLERSRSLTVQSRRSTTIRRRCFSESSNESSSEVSSKKLVFSKDKLGRVKIKWPRGGPLSIHLYPSRVIESTNAMHVNHLVNLVQQERAGSNIFNVIAIADGGPDWSVKGVLNLMSLGCLWKNLNLDVLVIQCYAPGHSRFNPIERSWSQLTKWLCGVILPVDIDGVIPKERDHESWAKVLDEAATLCAKFWHKKVYAGFPLSVETFLSTNPLVAQIKATHSLLHRFTNASAKKIREDVQLMELQKIYQFFVKHCNRKSYQIEFVRCQDLTCSHCRSLPIRHNDLYNMINEFHGTCPAPEPAQFYPGHYKTFLEMIRSQRVQNVAGLNQLKIINNSTSFGICPHKECSYAFFSKADELRHYRLMNHAKKK